MQSHFPPPNVVLHPDDANNKTFVAVAHAFLSVDNRAMTIKDVAQIICDNGYACANAAAAAQSITTYIRQHKARCDQQDDQPLLLSHVLSGTVADDDLLPALHSRSGGDSQPQTQGRLTNFRKGTAVWYMSRATGAPCPFARAGIRLCDYINQDEDISQKHTRRKKKTQQEESVCGQKRKRPLRGCVAQHDSEISDVEERPPKVKLTLRLKPLLVKTIQSSIPSDGSTAANPINVSREDPYSYDSADDEQDSMSVDSSDDEDGPVSSVSRTTVPPEEEPWSLPPYPRRSISIPAYTPSVEAYYSTYAPPPSNYRDPFRRSPSLTLSVGSPPPESEDESEDMRLDSLQQTEEEVDLGWEADLDSEADAETMWDSPGPRSPSAPLVYSPSDIAVKEEPRDLQGMLDAWEDYDSNIAGSRAVEVLAKALDTADNHAVKIETTDPWSWDSTWGSDEPRIKQEDLGFDSFLPGPSSPLSPISSLSSQFASFTWSDISSSSSRVCEEDIKHPGSVRPRSKTVPSSSIEQVLPSTLSRHSVSSGPPKSIFGDASVSSSHLTILLQSMSVNIATPSIAGPRPQPCVAPLQTRCLPSDSNSPAAEKIIVRTCQPCDPPITAVHMEDIPVFQMMLGAFQLLRRIDSDFVNLSPIIAYCGTGGVLRVTTDTGSNPSDRSNSSSGPSSLASTISPSTPSNVVSNATVITSGSPEICGTWVSLVTAQEYVSSHLVGASAHALEVFLSDTLFELFPPALQDFHRENASLRALNRFGRHFSSTLMVEGIGAIDYPVLKVEPTEPVWVSGAYSALSTPSTALGFLQQAEDCDVPLSRTEQELFHQLCNIPHDEVPGDEVMMIIEEPSAKQIVDQSPIPTTAKAMNAASKRRNRSSSVSSMSSLSSDDETLAQSTATIAVKPSITKTHSTTAPAPLRRSKRVADALAATHSAQPAPTTRSGRSRKGRL